MKKLFALILALALTACMPALAEYDFSAWTHEGEDTFMVGVLQSGDRIYGQDNYALRRYREITGVSMDFVYIPAADAETKLQLMMATGDYPEVFLGVLFGRDQQENYGSVEEIFLPLNDLIDEHMPTLRGLMEESASFAQMIRCADGLIYGVPEPTYSYGGLATKIYLNTTWLAALDLETPGTLDDFVEVLRAFRDQDPNGNGKKDEIPMSGSSDYTLMQPQYCLINCFIEVPNTSYFLRVLEDGKTLDFVASRDEFREGVRFVASLYEEGLIDPSSFTQTYEQLVQLSSQEEMLVGAFHANHISMGIDIANEALYQGYHALEPLEGPSGLKVSDFKDPTVDNGGWLTIRAAITDKCHDPARAANFIDFLLSTEGALIGYGEEGVAWNRATADQMGIDGLPAIFWQMTPSDDAAKEVIASNSFSIWFGAPFRSHSAQAVLSDDIYDLNNYNYRLATETKLQEAYQVEYAIPYTLLNASFSDEVSDSMADIRTNLMEYVLQSVVQFIIGEMDVDADWDTYLDTLNRYDLATYVQRYQTAYDAYLAAQ